MSYLLHITCKEPSTTLLASGFYRSEAERNRKSTITAVHAINPVILFQASLAIVRGTYEARVSKVGRSDHQLQKLKVLTILFKDKDCLKDNPEYGAHSKHTYCRTIATSYSSASFGLQFFTQQNVPML